MGRADVMEDVRTVFTAHQIDVVDAQVGRHGLEPRRLVGSLPLDPMRYPTPQALGGGEEGGTVGKRHPSEGSQHGIVEVITHPAEHGRVHPDQRPGRSGDGVMNVGKAERAQAGDDLGQLGPQVGHQRRLPVSHPRRPVR